MSSHRNLVAVVLILILAGIGLAIWNANQQAESEKKESAAAVSQGPEMVGKNVTFIVTEGEVKKWKLDSIKAVYNETRTEAKLQDVKGEFFDKDGKSVLHFTAPQGEYVSQDNKVHLFGGVVATSTQDNGGEMKAPEMFWDAKSKDVFAKGGVELTHSQGTSTAQTCRFDLDFSHISFQGNASSAVMSP